MGAFTGLPQPATSNPMVAELLNLSPGAKAALAGAAGAADPTAAAGAPGAQQAAIAPPQPGRLLPMAMPQAGAKMAAGGAVAGAAMPQGAPPSPEPLHMPPAIAMPQLGAAPAPELPQVKAPLGTADGDMAERARLIEAGRPASHIAQRVEDSDFGQNHPKWAKLLGNVGQVGAEVGDTLLSHVLPAATNALLGPAAGVVVRNIAQDVPGTTAHHNMLLNQADTHIGQDQKQNQQTAATEDTKEQTAERAALSQKYGTQAEAAHST